MTYSPYTDETAHDYGAACPLKGSQESFLLVDEADVQTCPHYLWQCSRGDCTEAADGNDYEETTRGLADLSWWCPEHAPIVCLVCEDLVDHDDQDIAYGNLGDYEGALLHGECAWGDMLNTLMRIDPVDGAVEKVAFNDAYACDVEYGEEPGSWFFDFSVGWKSTDGWRGYTTVTAEEPWTRVDSGWSGWGGAGTPSVAQWNRLLARMEAGDVPPPPSALVCALTTTSNVLSMGFDVFVEDVEAEGMAEWLMLVSGEELI